MIDVSSNSSKNSQTGCLVASLSIQAASVAVMYDKGFGLQMEVERHGSPVGSCLNCARLRSNDSKIAWRLSA